MSKSKYNVVTQMIFVMNMEQILAFVRNVLRTIGNKTLEYSRYFGVFGFLKKLCRLYFDEHAIVTDEVPKRQLKTLHKTIKKWQMTLRISLSILRFHNL
jgi:leucyl-tRNA synthetase